MGIDKTKKNAIEFDRSLMDFDIAVHQIQSLVIEISLIVNVDIFRKGENINQKFAF